ncbi:epithelial sodium channel subunit delta [Macrotis lagotis]|uniref:epithelial sodium channel subunit delta n=1 Tax=Macrotis lagotis TaxID=92651 RepID=UPI003D68B4E4
METTREQQKGERLIEFYDSFGDLFNFFCTNTTIHGMIRLVCTRHNRLKTAFWSLLFLATLGMLSWQFVLLFMQYWKYLVILTVSIHSEPKIFPSITLCDMNPPRSLLVQQYLEDLDEFAQENIYSLYKLNITKSQAGSQGYPTTSPSSDRPFHLDRGIQLENLDPQTTKKVGFKLCNSTGGDCFHRTHSSGVMAIQEWYQFHFINIMALLHPQNETSNYEAHNSNFIISCYFNGEACRKQDFQRVFHHPVYGSCYTFHNQEKNDFWKIKQSGLIHGISLTLKAKQDNSLPLMSTEAGFKVIIHARNQTPSLEHEGFNIRPGIETTISVREDELHHLEEPYGHCRKDHEDMDGNLYSRQACLHSCFQELMIQTCGCGYYFYPLPDGAQYCNYNQHPAWGHCFYKLYQNLKLHRFDCMKRCPKPCGVWVGKETVCLLALQHRGPLGISTENPCTNSQQESSNGYQRNKVARVHIFYQQLNYLSMDETPKYLVRKLLVKMSFEWSLWFGSSVLSVVEILELLLDATVLTFILGYRRFFGSRTWNIEASEGPGERVRTLTIQQDLSQLPWMVETKMGSYISAGPLQTHPVNIIVQGRFHGPWLQSGLKM